MSYWIVVVDDEAISLTNAKNMLSDEDMRVSCLRSGKDLMKFIEKNSPDLILLDIMMPEMDGFETYKGLRLLEEKLGRNKTPVIFLTGEKDSETERRGLTAGASDFIHKPFNKDVLIGRIKNTISNSKTIESLTEEATFDKLTGFLNKANGTKRIAGLCAEKTGALMVLDLDSFKLVNDLFGHDMGDRVLVAFSDIVRHNTRSEDVVSRIGGDEFLAFFADITEESAVEALTKRLNEQLLLKASEMMGEDFDIPLGISIGVVMVPEFGTVFETLFAYADNALYNVKQNGKHGYFIHRQEMFEDSQIGSLDKELDRIEKIMEERSDKSGALVLGQDSFSVVYRYYMRFHKRYGGIATELLFSLTPKPDMQDIVQAFAEFEQILQRSLRRSDIILKHRPNQFFVFLPELSKEDVPIVLNRILKDFGKTAYGQDVKVEHALRCLLISPERK